MWEVCLVEETGLPWSIGVTGTILKPTINIGLNKIIYHQWPNTQSLHVYVGHTYLHTLLMITHNDLFHESLPSDKIDPPGIASASHSMHTTSEIGSTIQVSYRHVKRAD